MTALTTAIIAALLGGVISPIVLDHYRRWRRERTWAAPRKALLRKLLQEAPGEGWITLDRLTLVTGTGADDCRTLLIEIEARGGVLKDGAEGWALISRQPLD